MIPIDFQINPLKVKVTVAFNTMIYRPNNVHMITTHRIDLGPSNFVQITHLGSVNDPYSDFQVINTLTMLIHVKTYLDDNFMHL